VGTPSEALSSQHATAAPQVGWPRILLFHDFASGPPCSVWRHHARYCVLMTRGCGAQIFQRPRNALNAPFSREVIRAAALRTI
jgi:hypothetical protein